MRIVVWLNLFPTSKKLIIGNDKSLRWQSSNVVNMESICNKMHFMLR
jgi:hypothetical protein